MASSSTSNLIYIMLRDKFLMVGSLGPLCSIFITLAKFIVHILIFNLTLFNDFLLYQMVIFIYHFVGQKLKTSVKKHNVNPVWNEDLTLSVSEPLRPIKLVCACLCLYNLSTLLAKLYRGHEEFACYEQIRTKKK